MAYAGIVKQKLDLVVYEQLFNRIVNGEFSPGQKIDINAITEGCNVSRTPVVQALKIMAAEGIFIVTGNGKFYIPEYSNRQVEDICKMRLLLEEEAVKQVIEENSSEALIIIEENVNTCMTYIFNQDVLGYRKADLQLHKSLITVNGNDCLTKCYTTVQSQFMIANHLIVDYRFDEHRESIESHANLLQCLKSKDIDGAKEILHIHILGAQNRILQQMENRIAE